MGRRRASRRLSWAVVTAGRQRERERPRALVSTAHAMPSCASVLQRRLRARRRELLKHTGCTLHHHHAGCLPLYTLETAHRLSTAECMDDFVLWAEEKQGSNRPEGVSLQAARGWMPRKVCHGNK